jgi:G:T-mismatch repair DNA endonuclease (very short patch repair protein)
MHIVVLAPSGQYSADALPALTQADQVTVVCWESRRPTDAADWVTVRESARSAWMVSMLSRSLAGRMVVRALPLDTGVRFWRASSMVPRVAQTVGEADMIIAAERDAGFAAWKWLQHSLRAGSAPMAVRGYAAARARIGRQ